MQDVPESELAALEVLWRRGPSTRREVAEVMYPAGGPAAYATVQKLLERLEKKGHVRKDGSPDLWRFTAVTARDELIALRLRDVADSLCGGSLAPLLRNLVRSRPLDDADIEELRAFIRDQRKEKL